MKIVIIILAILCGLRNIYAQNDDKYNITEPEEIIIEKPNNSIYNTIKELVPVFTEIEYFGGEIVDVHIGKMNTLGEPVLVHLEKGIVYGIISFSENKKVFDLNSYAFYLSGEKKIIVQSMDTTHDKYSRLILDPAINETYSIYVKPIFYTGFSEAYYCVVIFKKKE